jgi:hypothetical protein
VVRYDLRGHGDSDQPAWGHHVARYAADLRDLLEHLDLSNVTLVGASMGCAVIWSYIEIFGNLRKGREGKGREGSAGAPPQTGQRNAMSSNALQCLMHITS